MNYNDAANKQYRNMNRSFDTDKTIEELKASILKKHKEGYAKWRRYADHLNSSTTFLDPVTWELSENMKTDHRFDEMVDEHFWDLG